MTTTRRESCGFATTVDRAWSYRYLTKLHSCYLGPVWLSVSRDWGGDAVLEASVVARKSRRLFKCRVVDAERYSLEPIRSAYPRDFLERLPAATLSPRRSAVAYGLALRARAALHPDEAAQLQPFLAAAPRPCSSTELWDVVGPQHFGAASALLESRALPRETLLELYHVSLLPNVGVDALFNMVEYVQYVDEVLEGVDALPSVLTSVVNVADLDNAFMMNGYFVAGNGSSAFLPLVTIDVMGHEVSHLVVQQLAGLRYQGHSGALNEGFADILGCGLELFVYDKYNGDADKSNDLLGEPDSLMGEDAAKSMPFLRSLANPESASSPQPSRYRGVHWVDPRSPYDHGGVHTNSGVLNKCFWSFREKSDVNRALRVFFAALRSLHPTSTYLDAAEALRRATQQQQDADIMRACLEEVGLGEGAQLDVPV